MVCSPTSRSPNSLRSPAAGCTCSSPARTPPSLRRFRNSPVGAASGPAQPSRRGSCDRPRLSPAQQPLEGRLLARVARIDMLLKQRGDHVAQLRPVIAAATSRRRLVIAGSRTYRASTSSEDRVSRRTRGGAEVTAGRVAAGARSVAAGAGRGDSVARRFFSPAAITPPPAARARAPRRPTPGRRRRQQRPDATPPERYGARRPTRRSGSPGSRSPRSAARSRAGRH